MGRGFVLTNRGKGRTVAQATTGTPLSLGICPESMAGTGCHPVRQAPSGASCRAETSRNPLLLFRFEGVLLLRLAERQFLALLFQLPPRITRFEPDGWHPKQWHDLAIASSFDRIAHGARMPAAAPHGGPPPPRPIRLIPPADRRRSTFGGIALGSDAPE